MKLLTLKQLKEMEPGIFAQGEIEGKKWVAVRGGIHDWAMYLANPYSLGFEDSFLAVKKFGNKIVDEEIIKKLVPCDDEAFEMYRY
jgi:hypothetical protein